MNDDAVPDDTSCIGVEDARWDEMELVFVAFAIIYGVACVSTTLGASYNIVLLCKDVNELAFAFITPLGAENDADLGFEGIAL